MAFLRNIDTKDGPSLLIPLILTLGGMFWGLLVIHESPEKNLIAAFSIAGSVILFHGWFFLIAFIRAFIQMRKRKRPIWREKSPILLALITLCIAAVLLI